MTADPNKKSPRTFQCRDQLWDTFEQMARELECSIDYLINESMKQYARQRNYSPRGPMPTAAPGTGGYQPTPSPGFVAPPTGSYAGIPVAPPAPPIRHGGPPPPLPSGTGQHRPSVPMPPPMPANTPGRIPAPPNTSGRGVPLPPPIPTTSSRGTAPFSPPGGGFTPAPGAGFAAPPQQAAPAAGPPTLYIHYGGQRHVVNKDRFIIGRGKQSSDMTIKDPNVSRQHAMVELLNGQYYMVDMGSTNGVEFAGQRIARKVIAEGDAYKICDHELHFSYNG